MFRKHWVWPDNRSRATPPPTFSILCPLFVPTIRRALSTGSRASCFLLVPMRRRTASSIAAISRNCRKISLSSISICGAGLRTCARRAPDPRRPASRPLDRLGPIDADGFRRGGEGSDFYGARPGDVDPSGFPLIFHCNSPFAAPDQLAGAAPNAVPSMEFSSAIRGKEPGSRSPNGGGWTRASSGSSSGSRRRRRSGRRR